MRKKKLGKKNVLVKAIEAPTRIQFVVVSVFMFVFVALGAYYISQGHAASSVAYNCPARIYEWGGPAHCVKDVQNVLNDIHYNYSDRGYRGSILTTDGSFGPATLSAVEAFQRWQGFSDVNGVINPSTWNLLCHFTYPKLPSETPQAWAASKDMGCY